jgi:hypothetical protein
VNIQPSNKGATNSHPTSTRAISELLQIPTTKHLFAMPSLFALPRNVSPRLRNLQICQLSIVGVTIVSTLFAATIPSQDTVFTFSLLYSLILTSITTTILIRKEQKAAAQEILTKDKYAKYQLYKLVAAFCMGTLGFFMSLSFPGHAARGKTPNAGNGLWINGVKINTFHWIIIWSNVLNWCVDVSFLSPRICLFASYAKTKILVGYSSGPVSSIPAA